MSFAKVSYAVVNAFSVDVISPSTYDLLATSPEFVGVGKLVMMLVPPILILPDIVPPASGSFVAIELVIVVEKAASSLSAAASSLRVFNVAGAVSTRFEIDVSTYDLVAASELPEGAPSPTT